MREKLSFSLTVAVIVAVVIIFGLYSSDIIALPAAAGADEKEYGPMTDMSALFTETPVDTDIKTVREILATLSRPESYIWEAATTLRSGDETLTRHVRHWEKGVLSRTNTYDEDDTLLKSVLRVNETDLVITDHAAGTTLNTVWSEQYAPEAAMGMTSLSFFMEGNEGHIRAARLERLDSRPVVYVEYDFPELSQRELYWISVDYGVLLRTESYAGGTLVYEAETTAFSAEEPPDDLFTLTG